MCENGTKQPETLQKPEKERPCGENEPVIGYSQGSMAEWEAESQKLARGQSRVWGASGENMVKGLYIAEKTEVGDTEKG